MKEADIMWHLVSKAGSHARAPPAEQSLRLSIEETGSPVVQEHESVEESGSYERVILPSPHVLPDHFCDIREGKVLKLQMDEPQYSVPSKMKDDVDGQEYTTQLLQQEAGSSKIPSHEAEAKQGLLEEVPSGETQLFLTEKMNGPLTGITDPCEIQSPHVPNGNCKEKKKKRRRRRRKSVEKTEDQFLYKSFVELLRMFLTVLQYSLKMTSGLKVFVTTNLREIVSGDFPNLFRSCALVGAVVERGAILILLFLLIFHNASGLKTYEHMFNSTTILEYPITLLNPEDLSQLHVCNLKKLARCPERTKCSKNIDLCWWNNYSIKFFYSEEDCGSYAIEYGTRTDGQKAVHLVKEDCKESPTNTARTSRKDPQHVTTESVPTKRPGDGTSTVDKGIAGIAAGVTLSVLVFVGALITYFCYRRWQKKKKLKKNCLTPASSHTSTGTSIDSVI